MVKNIDIDIIYLFSFTFFYSSILTTDSLVTDILKFPLLYNYDNVQLVIKHDFTKLGMYKMNYRLSNFSVSVTLTRPDIIQYKWK